MSNIEIKNCVYKLHSVYDLYAANEDGDIINIVKKDHIGYKHYTGYMYCSVRKYGQKSQKRYRVHRFIWECFNGLIPNDKVIDHINDIKDDNRLCNLQLVTSSENSKKSAKNRDYSFVKHNNKNKKCVRATDTSTNEVSYYNSLYVFQQNLNINAGIVKVVCDQTYGRKTGISKKDGHSYKFEYVKKEDMPDDYIKAANIHFNLSDEEKKKHAIEATKKWQNKEFTCPRCDKTYKNSYKYSHNKRCK